VEASSSISKTRMPVSIIRALDQPHRGTPHTI
jgi:hypothetical protein